MTLMKSVNGETFNICDFKAVEEALIAILRQISVPAAKIATLLNSIWRNFCMYENLQRSFEARVKEKMDHFETRYLRNLLLGYNVIFNCKALRLTGLCCLTISPGKFTERFC